MHYRRIWQCGSQALLGYRIKSGRKQSPQKTQLQSHCEDSHQLCSLWKDFRRITKGIISAIPKQQSNYQNTPKIHRRALKESTSTPANHHCVALVSAILHILRGQSKNPYSLEVRVCLTSAWLAYSRAGRKGHSEYRRAESRVSIVHRQSRDLCPCHQF